MSDYRVSDEVLADIAQALARSDKTQVGGDMILKEGLAIVEECIAHRARLARPQPEGRLSGKELAAVLKLADPDSIVRQLAVEIQYRRARDLTAAEHDALSSLLAHVERSPLPQDRVLESALRKVLGKDGAA